MPGPEISQGTSYIVGPDGIQVQIPQIGASIVNTGSVDIILSPTDPAQVNAFTLHPGAATPWKSGPLYGKLDPNAPTDSNGNVISGEAYVNPGVQAYGGNLETLGVVTTSPIVDVIFNIPAGEEGPVESVGFDGEIAANTYQSIVAIVNVNMEAALTTTVTNTGPNGSYDTGEVVDQSLTAVPGTPRTFTLTLPINKGDTFSVDIVSNDDTISPIVSPITILGISVPLQVQVLPTDGIPIAVQPQGGSLVSVTSDNSLGTFPVLPAPPPGMSYRLWAFLGQNITFLDLTGVTTGGVFGSWGGADPSVQLAQGQLVTEGLEILASGTGSDWKATLTYDLVPTPGGSN